MVSFLFTGLYSNRISPHPLAAGLCLPTRPFTALPLSPASDNKGSA